MKYIKILIGRKKQCGENIHLLKKVLLVIIAAALALNIQLATFKAIENRSTTKRLSSGFIARNIQRFF
jgi:hypothetical protein